ncbi:DUF4395 domain-containing protein [Bacillaceae bacterium S4-13-58]
MPKSIPRPLVRLNQWTILSSVIIALITSVHEIMLIPLIAGLIGLTFGINPIMWIGKQFLKKPVKEYILEDVDQQRFNQIIAVTCLFLSYLGFLMGVNWMGYTFSIMVGLASGIAIAGFCIGCYIRFQWGQYQYRKKQIQ